MADLSFIYVTYIATTPEQLWEALTSTEFTEKYFFGTAVESDWNVGSKVAYLRNGEVTDYGEVLISEPPHLLSFTWTNTGDKQTRQQPTRVTFELQPMDATVKLILKHENLLEGDYVEDTNTFQGFNNGWPAILSNLKSLLETGKTIPALSL